MKTTLDNMKSAKRWLLRDGKVPHYAQSLRRRQTTDTPDDRAQLVTFDDAERLLRQHQQDGMATDFELGFALGPDGEGGCWQGIDLDKVDENGLADLISDLPGYVEHSPSGKGVHAIGYGAPFSGRTSRGNGVEFYSAGRFFTFTGNAVRDAELTDLAGFVYERLQPMTSPSSDSNQAQIEFGVGQVIVGPQVYDDLEAALKVIPADSYKIWEEVLQALKRLADTSRAFQLAMNWSLSSTDPEHNIDVFLRKWEGDLNTPGPLTYRSIFWLADQFDPNWRHKGEEADLWPEIDLQDLELEPIDYLIDGFLARSLMVLVGKPGIGKSTVMMALVAAVAGIQIPNSPLCAPVKGRKIIYIAEDTDQFKRNLIALCMNCGIDRHELERAIVLIPARRVKPTELLGLKQNVVRHTTFTPEGIMLRPWVVFDTVSAAIDLEDENSNAEVAAVLALLKAEFFEEMECSVCLIAHSAKQTSNSSLFADPRGAGAWRGDTTLTSGIYDDNGMRLVALDKLRYTPEHTALLVSLLSTTTTVTDRYGRPQTVVLNTALLQWADSPLVAKAIDKAARRQQELDVEVLRFVADRSLAGQPTSINGLFSVRDQIQKGLGKDRLRTSLERLESAGQLKKGEGVIGTNSGWGYSLTESGANLLAQHPT